MASQDDKDWEEYQHGLHGTSTGSAHNQMGLSDRPNKQNKKSRQNAQPRAQKNSKTEDFNPLFAIVAFIGTAVYLYNPPDENGVASLIFAGIAGFFAGTLYKFIIIAAVLAGIVFFLGFVKGGS